MRKNSEILIFFSSLLGSSFPRNPLTYQKGGFLEILFLGVGLVNSYKNNTIPFADYSLLIRRSVVATASPAASMSN